MIRAGESRELRAVLLGMKRLPREIRNDINRSTTATIGPVWKDEVTRRASSKMDARVIAAGTRLKPGNPPVLLAAQSRRPLKGGGGLVPRDGWQGREFGADRGAYGTYSRRNLVAAGTHQVERRTGAQLPARKPKGRIAYPAVAEVAPRIAALWVQLFVRRVHEYAEGKG